MTEQDLRDIESYHYDLVTLVAAAASDAYTTNAQTESAQKVVDWAELVVQGIERSVKRRATRIVERLVAERLADLADEDEQAVSGMVRTACAQEPVAVEAHTAEATEP